MQRSEWPLWRPSAAALPLLQLLPLPLICKTQAATGAGCCWAPPKTNSRTFSSGFTCDSALHFLLLPRVNNWVHQSGYCGDLTGVASRPGFLFHFSTLLEAAIHNANEDEELPLAPCH